jgi:hypothetical protein
VVWDKTHHPPPRVAGSSDFKKRKDFVRRVSLTALNHELNLLSSKK